MASTLFAEADWYSRDRALTPLLFEQLPRLFNCDFNFNVSPRSVFADRVPLASGDLLEPKASRVLVSCWVFKASARPG